MKKFAAIVTALLLVVFSTTSAFAASVYSPTAEPVQPTTDDSGNIGPGADETVPTDDNGNVSPTDANDNDGSGDSNTSGGTSPQTSDNLIGIIGLGILLSATGAVVAAKKLAK